MKTLQMEPRGVIWRLATFYGPLSESTVKHYGTDICELTRAALKGVLMVLLLTVILGVATALFADFVAWGLAMATTLSYLEPEIGAALFSAIFVVAILLILWTVVKEIVTDIVDSYHNRRDIKREEKVNAKSMFSAWKDRYCVKVEVKDAA